MDENKTSVRRALTAVKAKEEALRDEVDLKKGKKNIQKLEQELEELQLEEYLAKMSEAGYGQQMAGPPQAPPQGGPGGPMIANLDNTAV